MHRHDNDHVPECQNSCRYGDEAGRAASTGMGMAVDVYDVYGAYKKMRASAMARAFAKAAVVGPKPAGPAAAAPQASATGAPAPTPCAAAPAAAQAQEPDLPGTGAYPPLPHPPAPC
jgi:hypothetical protein